MNKEVTQAVRRKKKEIGDDEQCLTSVRDDMVRMCEEKKAEKDRPALRFS